MHPSVASGLPAADQSLATPVCPRTEPGGGCLESRQVRPRGQLPAPRPAPTASVAGAAAQRSERRSPKENLLLRSGGTSPAIPDIGILMVNNQERRLLDRFAQLLGGHGADQFLVGAEHRRELGEQS